MRAHSRLASLAATLLVAAALSASRDARADEPDEAAIRHGIALRKEQHDQEALDEFKRAFALKATPRAQAQIGLAEQALGRWIDAEADLGAALAAKGDAWIEKNRETLGAAKAAVERHLGTLEVTADVEGAELFVNGKSAGTMPHAPLRLEAGSVMLDVRAAGRAPARRFVDVPPGGVAREMFTLVMLQPIAVPIAEAPAPPAANAPRTSEPIAAGAPAKTESADGASDSRRTWGFVALGGAAVFLGVGIAETLDRNAHVSTYNNDATCGVTGKVAPPPCDDAKSAANRAEGVAIAGYVLAGVAAGAGVWLLATSGRSAPVKTSVGAWVGPGGAPGAALRGEF